LRTTFGTLMSKGGVAPRTAQAAMRHATLELTMNVYTDPRLLDVRGALDVLPVLPLDGDKGERQHMQATGTDPQPVAPTVAPTSGNSCTRESIPVKLAGGNDSAECGNMLPQVESLSTVTAGCHSLTTGRLSRGERIRTSDLLVPNQAL